MVDIAAEPDGLLLESKSISRACRSTAKGMYVETSLKKQINKSKDAPPRSK